MAVGELSVAPCPDDGAVKSTSTAGTGFPKLSETTTAKGVMKRVFVVALCGLPELIAIEAAEPGLFVSEKLAGVAAPATEAVTTNGPALVLAVGLPILALPKTSEFTISAVVNVALGPLPLGAANVTGTPDTGLPPESFT